MLTLFVVYVIFFVRKKMLAVNTGFEWYKCTDVDVLRQNFTI